jgi:hypothetical protein
VLHEFIAVNRDEIISRSVWRAGASTSSFARSSNAARIGPAWVSVWLSADGAPKRMTAASMRAIFLARDASLPLICLGFPFPMWKSFKRRPCQRRDRAN